MSHWTPSALAALTALSSRGKTQFTESSHVHYRCWIWPKCLGNYPCDWSELTKLTPTTTVDMTHDGFYNSDPDTQGRCSVRLPLQALYTCACVCVWWVGEGGVEWVRGSTKLRKKKQNPKISLLLASCRNINEPIPPNIKTGSTGVHQWGHASSPPRHQTDDLSSRVRRKRPKLRPTFWFCQRGCSDPHGALYNHVMNTRV